MAAGLLAGPGAGVAAGACTVSKSTAYDNPAEGNSATSVYAGQELAQSFKVPSGVTLNKVSLDLANTGPTTDAITVEIRSDTAGKPGAVMATRTRTLSNTTVAFTDFDFSSDSIALAAGTTYYIVASNTAAANGDGYTWQADGTGATYPDGSQFFSGNSGSTWVTVAGATSSSRSSARPASPTFRLRPRTRSSRRFSSSASPARRSGRRPRAARSRGRSRRSGPR